MRPVLHRHHAFDVEEDAERAVREIALIPPGSTLEVEIFVRGQQVQETNQRLRAANEEITRLLEKTRELEKLVYFDPDNLRIEAGAMKKTDVGDERPLVMADLQAAMSAAPRVDGRVRAAASLFLSGEPIGPFRYEGTRDDDPNDVVPHQHRRELRGSKVIASWINHFDSREANTLTTFMPVSDAEGSLGYVQHHILDFGDSLGSLWAFDAMSRRLGHAYYFDMQQVFVDFLTLGAIVRPWERVELHPVFGYFDAENFDPEAWKPGYPNPAFVKMDRLDAYWGAKIVSRFSDEHIRALVGTGEFSNPDHARYLEETLRARRDAIVNHYLRAVSPFDAPAIRGDEFCATDLLIAGGYIPAARSVLETKLAGGPWQTARTEDGVVCRALPVGARSAVLQLRARRHDQDDPAPPAIFHLRRETDGWRLVRIER